MIYVCTGSLLKSDCTVIAYETNCLGKIRGAFAKQLYSLFPEAYEADKRCRFPPRQKLGKFSLALSRDKERLIFNLYGRLREAERSGGTAKEGLREALERMFQSLRYAEEKGFKVKLGVPFGMGAKMDEKEWEVITQLIKELSVRYAFDVYLYNGI